MKKDMEKFIDMFLEHVRGLPRKKRERIWRSIDKIVARPKLNGERGTFNPVEAGSIPAGRTTRRRVKKLAPRDR